MGTPWHNAVPVFTGDRDDVCMEEDNSRQHEEDSVALTGVKKSRTMKWKPIQYSFC